MNWDFETLYLLAKIQAAVWTIVDAVCVALVLLILDDIRGRIEQRPRAWFRWSLLAASLLAFPLVLLAPDEPSFFKREVLVVSLQFAALVISLRDVPIALRFLKKLETVPLLTNLTNSPYC